MGEFLDIYEFMPFFDYEMYPLVPQEEERHAEERRLGIVSFRSFDGKIICERIDTAIAYIEANLAMLSEIPALHMQLQRIQGVEVGQAYPVWKTVSDRLFASKRQRRNWLESEHRLFQLQRRIWEELAIIPPDSSPSAFLGSLNDYSPERLFTWLDNRKNFLHRDWPKIWQNVVERLRFDARLISLAETWMYSSYSETQDLISLKPILFAVLGYHRNNELEKQEIGDFLSDAFDPDYYLIFEFIRPIVFFENVLMTLSLDVELNSSINLLEFCVLELPNDDSIHRIISSAAHRLARGTGDARCLARLAAVRAGEVLEEFDSFEA
jgi:hypothetical protein